MFARNESTQAPRRAPSLSVQNVTPASFVARHTGCLAVILIVAAGVIAYHNSFFVPFTFDDLAITDNPSVRTLWPPWVPFLPIDRPGYATERRPIANFSVALNYALGGTDVWGYHVFNLTAHLCAAIVLFNLIRRTLLLPSFRSQWTPHAATSVALVSTLIWTVHPLQTNAVTYVIQRTEVLSGLFCLLTLYCMLCGAEVVRPARWYAGAMACCVLAMGSKESAAALPVLALVYDRLFLCNSWGEVMQRRWNLYVGLFATWLVPFFYVWQALFYTPVPRGLSVPTAECFWSDYVLAQFESIALYVRLSFWPHPLILDYGFGGPRQLAHVAPSVAFVLTLVFATCAALRYWPALGFLGLWFFSILAPSSSIIPIYAECAAEKRMYLPLAAVVLFSVSAAYGLVARLPRQFTFRSDTRKFISGLGYALAIAAVVVLTVVSIRRNEDYHSQLNLWQDCVAKRPGNVRAYLNFAICLTNAGRLPEAMETYHELIRIEPTKADAYNNLAMLLEMLGQREEALQNYEAAIHYAPDYAEARIKCALLLIEMKRLAEANVHIAHVMQLSSETAPVLNNLAVALFEAGRMAEAIEQCQRAVQIEPSQPASRFMLGQYLAQAGRSAEAIEQFKAAQQLAVQSGKTEIAQEAKTQIERLLSAQR